jgi:sigma-B regulation protein RsbU (phosphoserine phosphatase)
VNDKEEMFGNDRLTELVTSHIKSTAQDMVDAIYQELSIFQGGVERFDDETVIVLKVLPGPG